MANQQLVDYINAQRTKGVARESINAALLGAGWSAADVNQAMDAAYGPAQPAVAASPTPVTSPVSASPISSPTSPAANTFFKPAASQQPTSGPVSFQAKPASNISPFSAASPSASPSSL